MLKFRLTSFSLILVVAVVLLLTAPVMATDGPPQLQGLDRGPIAQPSVQSGSAMELWRALGDAQGFDVIFDPAVRDTQLDLDVAASTLKQSLDRLALAAGQFWTPIDEETLVVAEDNPVMRRIYEPQVTRTFRLQDLKLKDAMLSLRSIYGLKNVVADSSRRTLTVRDTTHRMKLVESLLEQIDRPSDEVSIQVQLVAVENDLPEHPEDRLKAVRQMLNDRKAEHLARSTLNIVGDRAASLSTQKRGALDGHSLSLSLEVEAQVHPKTKEVTLMLKSNTQHFETIDDIRDNGGSGFSETSSWRMASRDTRLIPLAGTWGQSRQNLVLLVSPTIQRIGTSAEYPALWVGHGHRAEDTIKFVSREVDISPDQREEVRQRLRKRLANLSQGDSGIELKPTPTALEE